MSISASDIIWRRATVMDPLSASNGGRMTHTSIPSSVKGNIWPDVPHAERIAGSTKHMKVYVHVANETNLRLIQPRLFIETQTPGDDAIVLFPGSFTDTQAAVAPSRVYGAGKLNASVTTGASVLAVMTEGAALDYFKAGDLIRVSDKASVISVTGNVQYIRIAGGGVSYSGDVATLTLDGTLSHDFNSSNTKVASVIEPDDVVGSYTNLSLTASGTFDSTTYPIIVNSVGGVYDDWTVTFTNGTNFTCVGAHTGSVGTGNISSDFSPANPAFSRPFFTITREGWGGTFTTGNTLTFRTLPAAVPLWYRRVIPAGAGSLSGNHCFVAIDGESE